MKKMKMTTRRLRRAAFAALMLWFAAVPTEAKDKHEERSKLLTRSIYLPVEFRLCEHLTDAVLYQGEQAMSLLPAKRIFQFTYYPKLERIEPARTDVRVEGHREDGSDFIGKLAVTPFGVFTANHKIELDMNEQLAKMRYKLDTRYDTLTIRLRCSDSCQLKDVTAVTADAGTDGSSHK